MLNGQFFSYKANNVGILKDGMYCVFHEQFLCPKMVSQAVLIAWKYDMNYWLFHWRELKEW